MRSAESWLTTRVRGRVVVVGIVMGLLLVGPLWADSPEDLWQRFFECVLKEHVVGIRACFSRDSRTFFHLAIGKPLDPVRDPEQFSYPIWRVAVDLARDEIHMLCRKHGIAPTDLTEDLCIQLHLRKVGQLPRSVPAIVKIDYWANGTKAIMRNRLWGQEDRSSEETRMTDLVLEDGVWKFDLSMTFYFVATIHLTFEHAMRGLGLTARRSKCDQCGFPYPDMPPPAPNSPPGAPEQRGRSSASPGSPPQPTRPRASPFVSP